MTTYPCPFCGRDPKMMPTTRNDKLVWGAYCAGQQEDEPEDGFDPCPAVIELPGWYPSMHAAEDKWDEMIEALWSDEVAALKAEIKDLKDQLANPSF